MVTSELLLKLELGPGLTEDPVRLVVASAEIRAILWGAGLVQQTCIQLWRSWSAWRNTAEEGVDLWL